MARAISDTSKLSAEEFNEKIMQMEIYIPSRSRFDRCPTLEALTTVPKQRWPNIYLVVHKNQKQQYRELARRHKVPLLTHSEDTGLSAIRRWIGDQCEADTFVMMDDDLKFVTRRPRTNFYPGTNRGIKPEEVKLHQFNPYDMWNMLWYMSRLLYEEYAHVAVSMREGNNRQDVPLVEVSRAVRVLGYRTKEFNECEHDRLITMADFDYTLQLLRRGYKNAVITEYAQDHGGTQTPGGCSEYRTHKVHEESIRRMLKFHGQFLKVRDKENKTGGEFGTRKELTIYWSKAYKSAFEELF